LTAKSAYVGAVDQTLPARIRTALVFQADVPLAAGATSVLEWQKLRRYAVDDKFSFQLRWEPDHLSVFVDAQDATIQAADKLTFKVGANTYTFNRDATGDVSGVVAEVSGGWKAVVHLPLSAAQQNDQVQFDIALTDGVDTFSWNDAGATGTLTLAEPLSYLEVTGIDAGTAPTIDGSVDAVWALAGTVSTGKQITGTNTATADVKTLWKDDTLYVLAHVYDAILNDTASDPWQKDSLEIYVDAGNYKNGVYRPDDTHIRINYKNEVSFDVGDTAAQQARLVSATSLVADGYIVEASINLLDESGVDTFHGLDFQVNDATSGARVGIRNWADPTNAGYLSTSHWGVGQLTVSAADVTAPDTSITSHPSNPSNSTSASFDFTGSDEVGGSGVAAFECDLDGGGFSACTSPKSYTSLSNGSHTFQVRAKDTAGNTDATPASFTWVVDTTAPVVNSVMRASASPTNLASVQFTVTFSESVTGVDVSDFSLTKTGVTGSSITGVSGTGAIRTVTVNTGSGNGTIRLNVLDDNSILDTASNPLNGAYNSGQVYAIDKTVTLTFMSNAAQDGWILESSETSSTGGTMNSAATTINLGDDATKKQYLGILSFSTGAGLPDTAVITGVTLKVRKQTSVGSTDPVTLFQGFMADIKAGFFGTSAALELADFHPTMSNTYGPFLPALVSNVYTIDLTAGKAFVNKLATNGGVTQLRLRFKLDDNNNALANYLSLYSGNAATAANRPQLVIKYYIP
jgi:hypothetical protein